MNESGTFIATLLDSSPRAYAAAAVARAIEAGGERAQRIEAFGFNRFVGDIEIRLRHLAEALAAGRPELMLIDIEWLKTTYSIREVPLDLLVSALSELRIELEENLPEASLEMACDYLDGAIDSLKNPAARSNSLVEPETPHVDLARGLLVRVMEGRLIEAQKLILDALDDGVSIAELHLDVIAKAQAEMGRLWQVGDATVADEHMGSRLVQDVLAVLRSKMPRTFAAERSVLTASVPGNLHDIGARIVADHFEMAGWKSYFLGADMPTEDLVRSVFDHEPDLIALSVGLGLNVRAAADAIDSLRARGAPPIMVGGGPMLLVPDLWKDVGADGFAPDARAAVIEGERLSGGSARN